MEKASREHDAASLKAARDRIAASCKSCHAAHRYRPDE
jgi:hypothetical protein